MRSQSRHGPGAAEGSDDDDASPAAAEAAVRVGVVAVVRVSFLCFLPWPRWPRGRRGPAGGCGCGCAGGACDLRIREGVEAVLLGILEGCAAPLVLAKLAAG